MPIIFSSKAIAESGRGREAPIPFCFVAPQPLVVAIGTFTPPAPQIPRSGKDEEQGERK